MLLAATGIRTSEALHIQVKDIDFEKHPVYLYMQGENTKTKTDSTIFLTEVTNQLNSWLKYKYRTRRVCHQITEDDDNKEITNKKTLNEYRSPSLKKTDLLFASADNNGNQSPDPYSLYIIISGSFAKTLNRMNKGEREVNNERRRQITLHSFRRFVKSTISDLRYSDYSEWFIGRPGSTYYRKKESEKIEIFRKFEPYLTFLNVHQLER